MNLCELFGDGRLTCFKSHGLGVERTAAEVGSNCFKALTHEFGNSRQNRDVLHLHGEIDFARSSVDETLIYPLNGAEIKLGDRCQKGSQLRPHIVWFGEAVPMMEEVIPLVEMADILLVIGTSLAVYPAAGLVNYAPPYSKKYYIDPQGFDGMKSQNFKVISKKAGEGVPKLVKELMP